MWISLEFICMFSIQFYQNIINYCGIYKKHNKCKGEIITIIDKNMIV